jgi:endo-1,4-beta-xylanase
MRFSLAATTLLAGLATAAPSSNNNNNVNLDKIARRNGMLWFGTAADIPGTSETTDKSYLKVLQKQFGEMTPANALKVSQSAWYSLIGVGADTTILPT